jgi:ABC-2 type transport system permease protein/lipopolysaccharide transport system permease protein
MHNLISILRITLIISWTEIIIKYRKSIIGPFWIVFNMSIIVFSLSFVFAGFFGQGFNDYVLYIYCGILGWSFISTLISESTNLYVNGSIKNFKFHTFYLPLINVNKILIIFFHNFIVYFILIIFIKNTFYLYNLIYILIALLIYILNGICISFSVGLLSLKFRDFGFMISNILFLIFLITPIFWDPKILSVNRAFIVEFNPFFHFIEILRRPLLGEAPNLENLLYAIILTLLNIFLAYITYKKLNKYKYFYL